MGGKQSLTVINESGLYSLLIAMQPQESRRVCHKMMRRWRERMEMVRRFRRWITHEVIPSVRRNGIYMTDTVMEGGKREARN